jgi:hypothetical protein
MREHLAVDYKLSHPTKLRRLIPTEHANHGPLFEAQETLL